MEFKNLPVMSNKQEDSSNSVDVTNKIVDQQTANVEQSTDVSNNRLKYGRVVILLENPILPDDTILHTPSMNDGLEQEVENDLRITGCKLIQISGILLRLPQVAMATGQVLFQRFYYSKSFVRQPMEITAMACVVLASKVEEAPRRIRDVINVFHNMKQIRLGQPTMPVILNENYVFLKNQVIKSERRILKELGFCVHVKHPHKFIVAVAQILKNENNAELIQAAWSYMNDSLQTNVFVRFPPEAIACACIHLSSRVLRVPLPTKPLWYELFNVVTESIESICKSILMLYIRKPLDQEELETKVEEARQKLEAEKVKARQKQATNLLSLENINSPILIDSRTNSPSCTNINSESITNSKNQELKSIIGKLVNEKVSNNNNSETFKQQAFVESRHGPDVDMSDHSSVSSSSSFKLQKSPIKNEEVNKTLKRLDQEDSSENNSHDKSSFRYKNGHSTTQDFYYYSNNNDNSKERREEKVEEKEYKSGRYSNDNRSLLPSRSYISSTIVTNNRDDRYDHRDRYRDSSRSRSRSRSPISSPYDNFYSSSYRHKYSSYRRSDHERSSKHHHRSGDDYGVDHRSSSSNSRYDRYHEERRYQEERTSHRRQNDYRTTRSRSPNHSPNSYSSSRYHYHKSSSGKY